MSNHDADREERVFQRMDPDGALGRLLTVFRPLAKNSLARGIVSLLTAGRADLSVMDTADQQTSELTSTTARSVTLSTPLGWAPTAYEDTKSTDVAEQILLDGWKEAGRLRLRPDHLISFGRGDEELESVFRARQTSKLDVASSSLVSR
jgi:hypothetical protein